MLFPERIEAWANGPVVPDLYDRHRGKFKVRKWKGDPDLLDDEQRATIDGVLRFYGPKTSQWLSDLTHAEEPWQEARRGLAPGDRGNQEITLDSMLAYYSGLS